MQILQPMPLLKRAAPFDGLDWLFELKYDGFRALVIIEHGRAQLLSRKHNEASHSSPPDGFRFDPLEQLKPCAKI